MSIRSRAGSAAARWFFAYFGLLLLIAASAAQWSVLAWWLYVGWGVEWPWPIHLLAVAVPVDAVVGSTFARFRVSSAGAPGPGGAADDGEVEDHPIDLFPAVVFDSGGFEDGTFGDWTVVTP